jgi:sugar lactone lactonase YvrE
MEARGSVEVEVDREFEILLSRGSFFEGPRWHDGKWWLSDLYRHVVHSIDQFGRDEVVARLDDLPCGLGWLPDGSLLIVSMKKRLILRRYPDGSIETHADLSQWTNSRLNDMVSDGRGRAWVGNYGFDLMGGAKPESGKLFRVDVDGSVSVAAEDLVFPNGAVITSDGRTLIVGETFAARYTAFSISDDGELLDRRLWAKLGPEPTLVSTAEMLADLTVVPDGCALDAEGCLWVADTRGQRCIRVASSGAIVEEIRIKRGGNCYACALGGDDGLSLVLCIATDSREITRLDADDGVVIKTRVLVPAASPSRR